MSAIERAWAAGFFDGEGNVRRRKGGRLSRPGYTIPQLQVAQTGGPALLERFRDAVGAGKVYGPYGPYKANKKPYWTFVATGPAPVATCFEALAPYLGAVKSAQFMEALRCGS